MTNRPTIVIAGVEREMNDQELAQYEKDQLDWAAEKKAEAAKTAEKAALLERLGITAEEAALLLA